MTEKAKKLGNEYVHAPEGYDCGITKREYFAGLAMQAISSLQSFKYSKFEDIAKFAIEQADALLEELSKEV